MQHLLEKATRCTFGSIFVSVHQNCNGVPWLFFSAPSWRLSRGRDRRGPFDADGPSRRAAERERPPQQLSATELRSRIALLEHAARAYRAELESRTARLDGNPFGDEGLAALVAPPPADYGVSYSMGWFRPSVI